MAEVLHVRCPDCGTELRVDAETGMVVGHKAPAVRHRGVDLDRSQDVLRRQEEERNQRFAQSVEAEKKRDELLSKKFDQSMRRVRDNPNEPRPIRDVDLD
ncbi:MAG TPA: hypothetical protein VN515_10150 [Terriglobales bacterium]|nr:hypothetical protein [Terriglobales bacterium]